MSPRRAEKIVGVVGGMGPAAALEFCRLLFERDGARRDQDHLRVILDNNCKIPDRTAAIFGGGRSPAREIVRTARGLERAGCGVIAVPCNTAHAWIGAVRSAVKAVVPSIVEETVGLCMRMRRRLRAAGLLATEGTIATGLYRKAFGSEVEVLVPGRALQRRVTKAILAVKAGRPRDARAAFAAAARELVARGAELIIAGCTEVPLALSRKDARAPLVDSMRALAEATVRLARGGREGRASRPHKRNAGCGGSGA